MPKISEFKASPARTILAEAEKRGLDLAGGIGGQAVILFGLADIIRELREEVAALKPNTLGP